MVQRKRKCSECNRKKARHLWLAAEWKKKGPARCKHCYKRGQEYRSNLGKYLMKTYNITLKEYDHMLARQGKRCAICRRFPGKRRLAVDHNHRVEEESGTRKSVRGLLCGKCNEFLGHIGDDPQKAENMRIYLNMPTAVDRGLLQ